MKGSEKQIKWATEIRENVVKSLRHVMDSAPANIPESVRMATIEKLQRYIDRLNEDDVYAGDIIELFKDIRFGADQKADDMKVASVYNSRVLVPNTDGQRRLLCK